MNDSEAVKIAARIDRLHRQATMLIFRLQTEHRNGDAMFRAIEEECLPVVAEVSKTIIEHLNRPDRYCIERLKS